MFLLALNLFTSEYLHGKYILITAYSELLIFYLKCSFLSPLSAMMVKEIHKKYLIFPSHLFMTAEYVPTLCTKDHSYCVRGVFHAAESQYLNSCSTIAAILLSCSHITVILWLDYCHMKWDLSSQQSVPLIWNLTCLPLYWFSLNSVCFNPSSGPLGQIPQSMGKVNGEKTWSLWKVKANVSSSEDKMSCCPSCEKQSEEKESGSGLLVVNTSELPSLII